MKIKPIDRTMVSDMLGETLVNHAICSMESVLYEYTNKIQPFMCRLDRNEFSPEEKYNELKKIYRDTLNLIMDWVVKPVSDSHEKWESSNYSCILENIENVINVEEEREYIENIDKSKDDDDNKYNNLWERCKDSITELRYRWKGSGYELSYIESPTETLKEEYEAYDDEEDDDDEFDEYDEKLYSGFYAYCSSKLPHKDKQSLEEDKITLVSDMNDECNIFIYSDAQDAIVKKEIEEAKNKGIMAMTINEFYDFTNSI